MTQADRPFEVLIVEDSPTQALELQALLEAGGYTVAVAHDGVEGLGAATEGAFDLVVSDVNMPRMNGFELCRRIKEDPRTQHLPFLMLTDRHRIADLLQALEVGADNFVTKPFHPEELLSRVRRLLDDVVAWNRRRDGGAARLMPPPEEVILRFEKAQIVDLLIASAQKLDEEMETVAGSFRMLTFDKGPEELQEYLVERIAAMSEADCTVMAVWAQGGPEPFTRVQSQDQEVAWAVGAALSGASTWLAREFAEDPSSSQALELEVAAVPPLAGLARDCGLASCLAAPLAGHGRVVGAILAFYRPGHAPSRDARRRCSSLAALTMVVLENRHQLQAAHEANRRLEETLAEVKQMQSRIIEQERLRALGQMAGGIAHDLNNSLSPILGFCELLLGTPDGLEDRAKAERYLRLIRTGAVDAASVVRRLREVYRPREAEELLVETYLDALLVETIALTEPRWKAQAQASGVTITVATELAGTLPLVCNPPAIRELLTTLILNAVDALPSGGAITLRGYQERGEVVVQVADNGTGMDEEACRRCFEPFFTTKGDHGTGLGLAMAHGIAQRHQGSIAVESAPGQGTTFTMRLPQGRAVAPPSPVREPVRGLSILVVDDEPLVRAYLTECLRRDDHHVEAVSGGEEALRRFRPGRFDLVLTDLAMPGMSGDQLAKSLKKLSPATPIILLTGFGDLLQSTDTRPPDVDLTLSKPVGVEDLRQALAGVIAQHP